MFYKLKLNYNSLSKASIMKTTVIDILKGTLTNTNQLNASLFNIASCEILPGYHGSCAWTEVFSNSSYTILRNDSFISGKYLYLKISTTDENGVSITTGSGFDSTNNALYHDTGTDTFRNRISVNESSLSSNYNGYCYIIASNSSFTFCGNNAGHNVIFSIFDGFNNAYESYSLEGRMKVFYATTGDPSSNLLTCNAYQPYNNTYNNTINNYTTPIPNKRLGISVKADLTTPMMILHPIRFVNLWAGSLFGNIPNIYKTSVVSGVPIGTLMTINADNFMFTAVISESSSSYLNCFLVRI